MPTGESSAKSSSPSLRASPPSSLMNDPANDASRPCAHEEGGAADECARHRNSAAASHHPPRTLLLSDASGDPGTGTSPLTSKLLRSTGAAEAAKAAPHASTASRGTRW